LRSTIIYFINGIDLVVPPNLYLAYLWYVTRAVWWGFFFAFIFAGMYNSLILLLSVVIGDFKFFTDLIEVKEFMEDSE